MPNDQLVGSVVPLAPVFTQSVRRFKLLVDQLVSGPTREFAAPVPAEPAPRLNETPFATSFGVKKYDGLTAKAPPPPPERKLVELPDPPEPAPMFSTLIAVPAGYPTRLAAA